MLGGVVFNVVLNSTVLGVEGKTEGTVISSSSAYFCSGKLPDTVNFQLWKKFIRYAEQKVMQSNNSAAINATFMNVIKFTFSFREVLVNFEGCS